MHDDFDSVVADRFKVLDHVPVPDTWSRVQRKVLDHKPAPDTRWPVAFTEEVVAMIDVQTTDPTETSHKGPRRVVVAGILAAAAVVAIAFVVIRDADDVTPGDEPSTTVTPTPLSGALPNTPWELLEPGTYFVDEVDGTRTARISFTIGAGWRDATDGQNIWQDPIGGFGFSRADRVFSDACRWESGGYYAGSVATLDGLVAALTEQQGWAEVTAPSDISIDGYDGKALQRTAPAIMPDCDLVSGNSVEDVRSLTPMLASWTTGLSPPPGGQRLYAAGSIETLWVLDIDGTVIIISTFVMPGPSAGSPDFAADVLHSIRIERV